LRLIREILFYEPEKKGTDVTAALNYVNRVLAHKAVMFLISDFQAGDFSKALSVTARRHDLVAIPIVDPREEDLPNVGIIRLEDAETGEQIEVDTSNSATRAAFLHIVEKRKTALFAQLRRNRIDSISLHTDQDYLPALRNFFRQRERRLMLQ
jgi:uncharacterized protein (DUF58 family)